MPIAHHAPCRERPDEAEARPHLATSVHGVLGVTRSLPVT